MARKVVPLLITPKDVPRFTKRIELLNRKSELDKVNWRTEGNAMEAMSMLRGYYVRTGDKVVERYFLKIIEEAEPARIEYLESALEEWVNVRTFCITSYEAPVKGLQDTAFIKELHRRYRTYETLDSSLAAVNLLIGIDRYRPEMIWFLCTVMKEPKYEVSKAYEKDWKRRSGLVDVTRREIAQVDAKGILGADAAGRQDVEVLKTYLVPWDKTLSEKPNLQPLTGHTKFPFWEKDLPIDNVNIPAGQPVPPKPKTVVPLPEENQPKEDDP